MRDRPSLARRLDCAGMLILEYEQLKEEQRLRITSRDNLVYATLVAIGAICGAAFQAGSPTVLLLLPAVCTILGWTYLVNDRKVSQIRRHIQGPLAAQLASALAVAIHPFGWETAHRSAAGHRTHKLIQMAMTLLTFCGPGLAAIVANLTVGRPAPLTLLLMVAGALAIGLLAHQVLTNADIRPDKPPPSAPSTHCGLAGPSAGREGAP